MIDEIAPVEDQYLLDGNRWYIQIVSEYVWSNHKIKRPIINDDTDDKGWLIMNFPPVKHTGQRVRNETKCIIVDSTNFLH